MKAKSSTKTVFYCSECGNETAKWMGQCPAFGAWNTLVEAPKEPKMSLGTRAKRIAQPKLISELDAEEELRFSTGIGEFDRVLGGGAVRGSLVLVGGAPGIGQLRDQRRCLAFDIIQYRFRISEVRLAQFAERHPVNPERR